MSAFTVIEAKCQFNKEVNIASVRCLNVSEYYKVVILDGESRKVVARAKTKALLDNVLITQVNNCLNIQDKKKVQYLNLKTDPVTLYITSSIIDDITISGAVILQMNSSYVKNNLNVHTSVASEATLNVKVKRINLSMSGESKIDLSGTADTTTSFVSGGCELNANKANIQHLELLSSGFNKINFGTLKYLHKDVNKETYFNYLGKPIAIDKLVNKSYANYLSTTR